MLCCVVLCCAVLCCAAEVKGGGVGWLDSTEQLSIALVTENAQNGVVPTLTAAHTTSHQLSTNTGEHRLVHLGGSVELCVSVRRGGYGKA